MAREVAGVPYLRIDMTKVEGLVKDLKRLHTEEEFKKILNRSIRRVSKNVRTLLKRTLPHDYHVRQSWVAEKVGAPVMRSSGEVQCLIPIKGARAVLGENGTTARKIGSRRRYRVRANIVKSGATTLPRRMTHQGGNPPFIVATGRTRKGSAFTRTTAARYPIARLVGLGVPQMPLNRSMDEIENEIVARMTDRLIREHNYMVIGRAVRG